MVNNWVCSNGNYYLREVSQQKKILPVGVFKINYDPRAMEFFISHNQDKFEFPYKIYGAEIPFIERVKKTFDNTKGNLGILMNGVKGTGKTVTSQMICNELQLPVLIIHERYDGVASYINEIQQDIIIFIDEYEKIYPDYDYSVLTVMDGVLNNGYRKLFLLTTNNLHINSNLLQRPGRLRYVKTFKDLSLEAILEIVNDKLKFPELKDQIIEFISSLETITIDIVKAVVDECNIHEEAPLVFKDVFNVSPIENIFNVYIEKKDQLPGLNEYDLKYKESRIDPIKIDKESVGEQFHVNGRYIGEIKRVDDEIVYIEVENYDEEKDENTFTLVKYKVERAEHKHKSFNFYF